jgi:hypothetical protein
MAIKQGDSVTNSKCSHWGSGVVVSIGASSAEVRFPSVGPKRLLVGVLVRSSECATIVDKKGRKADPQYQARLRELVNAFSTAANREAIQDIEAMIYKAFLVSGDGKPAIKRLLTQWMNANPRGLQEKGFTDAKALFDFLFPDPPPKKRAG